MLYMMVNIKKYRKSSYFNWSLAACDSFCCFFGVEGLLFMADCRILCTSLVAVEFSWWPTDRGLLASLLDNSLLLLTITGGKEVSPEDDVTAGLEDDEATCGEDVDEAAEVDGLLDDSVGLVGKSKEETRYGRMESRRPSWANWPTFRQENRLQPNRIYNIFMKHLWPQRYFCEQPLLRIP